MNCSVHLCLITKCNRKQWSWWWCSFVSCYLIIQFQALCAKSVQHRNTDCTQRIILYFLILSKHIHANVKIFTDNGNGKYSNMLLTIFSPFLCFSKTHIKPPFAIQKGIPSVFCCFFSLFLVLYVSLSSSPCHLVSRLFVDLLQSGIQSIPKMYNSRWYRFP